MSSRDLLMGNIPIRSETPIGEKTSSARSPEPTRSVAAALADIWQRMARAKKEPRQDRDPDGNLWREVPWVLMGIIKKSECVRAHVECGACPSLWAHEPGDGPPILAMVCRRCGHKPWLTHSSSPESVERVMGEWCDANRWDWFDDADRPQYGVFFTPDRSDLEWSHDAFGGWRTTEETIGGDA